MTASESQRRTNPTSYTNGWVKTSALRGNAVFDALRRRKYVHNYAKEPIQVWR